MNLEEFRALCLSLPGAEENMPWAEPRYNSLVTFSVGGKWFCLLDLDSKRCNVKCDPEVVALMQSRYEGAMPAWHMNKEHWLGVQLESDLPDAEIRQLITAAHTLILNRLPKRLRAALRLP